MILEKSQMPDNTGTNENSAERILSTDTQEQQSLPVQFQAQADLKTQETRNSLLETREKVKQMIIASGEAQQISDQITITSMQSIIDFGKPVASQVSRVADSVLNRSKTDMVTDTARITASIQKVMQEVDIDEIKEDETQKQKQGFFAKIFSAASKTLDQLIAKYDSIGSDLERICVDLHVYEEQIKQANKDLQSMYEGGVENYKTLVKYTIAGEMAIDELQAYRKRVEAGEVFVEAPELEINNLNYAEQLLTQRVHDLRLAESIALQSLPTLKAIEFGNMNLARKLNSAFIITIPVFKNALAQAMFVKQQSLQAKALTALDEATNEILLKNSQNVANNMRDTAMLSGKAPIAIDTIEQSWQNIMDGIHDTQAIQVDISRQREQDRAKLEEITKRFALEVKA